jgi:ankyrin repeat protein
MQALRHVSDKISRELPEQQLVNHPPIICVFGQGISPDIVNSLKNNWVDHHLKINAIGTGNEVLQPKVLIDKAATRLTNGSHLMLCVHGTPPQKTNNNKHHLLINASPAGAVSTLEFLEALFTRVKQLDPAHAKTHLPLPVVHILSCYSGSLSNELLPDNPLWKSAHIVVYSSKKFTCPNHYSAAMDNVARYVSDCARREERVDPLRLFYLAGSHSGDCLRLLGGDLQAPLILHSPKVAADLSEERLQHRLEGGLNDKTNFYLSAIETKLEEHGLSTSSPVAIAEFLQTRIGRRDLPSVAQLLNDYPDLINQPSFAGVLSLNVAILEDYAPIIDLLLESGANLRRTDFVGVGPTLTALPVGNKELLARLLTKGASPNETDIYGNSALFLAILQRSIVAAAMLIEHGANINYVYRDETALSLAVDQGDIAMVELLLKNGVGRAGGLSYELATTAVQNNQIKIAELLYRALLSSLRT